MGTMGCAGRGENGTPPNDHGMGLRVWGGKEGEGGEWGPPPKGDPMWEPWGVLGEGGGGGNGTPLPHKVGLRGGSGGTPLKGDPMWEPWGVLGGGGGEGREMGPPPNCDPIWDWGTGQEKVTPL